MTYSVITRPVLAAIYNDRDTFLTIAALMHAFDQHNVAQPFLDNIERFQITDAEVNQKAQSIAASFVFATLLSKGELQLPQYTEALTALAAAVGGGLSRAQLGATASEAIERVKNGPIANDEFQARLEIELAGGWEWATDCDTPNAAIDELNAYVKSLDDAAGEEDTQRDFGDEDESNVDGGELAEDESDVALDAAIEAAADRAGFNAEQPEAAVI